MEKIDKDYTKFFYHTVLEERYQIYKMVIENLKIRVDNSETYENIQNLTSKIQEKYIELLLQMLNLHKEEDYKTFKYYYRYCKSAFGKDKHYSFTAFYDKLIEYFPEYRSFLKQGLEKFPDNFKPEEICNLETFKDVEIYLIKLHKELDKYYSEKSKINNQLLKTVGDLGIF